MPNWKKITTSGSDAALNSLYVTTSVTASVYSGSYIDLDVLSDGDVPPHRPGRIYFGEEDGALEVYNEEADITLQVGQEFWVRVYNDTLSTIPDGTPVRASGSQGDRFKIYPALAEDHRVGGPFYDNHILGVTTHDIEASSEGYVTSQGVVRGINTSTFDAGDILYLQTGSVGYRNTPPPFPYDIIQVGYVARSSAVNGFIYVSPLQPTHLANITGISGSNGDVGDLLVYQSNLSWTPTKTLSGSYTIDNGDLDIDGDLDIGTGAGLDAITSGGGTVILARFNNTTNEYTYGPIAANPATNDLTFQGDDIHYGNISTGYAPFQNTTGMTNGPIQTDFAGKVSINYPMSFPIPEALSVLGSVSASGNFIADGSITGSDVLIDDWGSVSASLAAAGGVTINNNTDNYILTATGTANTINGESGLKFDGNFFHVDVSNPLIARFETDDLYVGDKIEIYSDYTGNSMDIVGTVNSVETHIIGSTTGGAVFIGDLFYVLVDNVGNVGIGQTSPDEKLHVGGDIKTTNALLSNQENTDVDTGTETVAEISSTTYTAAFFDYVIKNGTNLRAGTVFACHDGSSNVEYNEVSTNDLGDTSDVTLSVDISGGNIRLRATTTSDNWNIKSLVRAL